MDGNKLDATMMLADWRGALPNWLWIDAAECAALDPHTLPPVPVIAVGDRRDRGVEHADMVAADVQGGAALGRAIDAMPVAAAATILCLRGGAGLTPMAALTLESTTMAMLQGSAEHRSWLAARALATAVAPGEIALARQGASLDIRIVRPDARNAIDRGMRDALYDAFALAAADADIATIRLGAAGRCFSVGADLAEFGTTRDPAQAHGIRLRTLPALPLLRRRAGFEVRVQGACVGSGLELAAFADRLVATKDAWFRLPELAMGILPGFGGTVSIPRRIGRQRTAELIVSGRRIGARAALAIGLIDAIVNDATGDDRGADLIGR